MGFKYSTINQSLNSTQPFRLSTQLRKAANKPRPSSVPLLLKATQSLNSKIKVGRSFNCFSFENKPILKLHASSQSYLSISLPIWRAVFCKHRSLSCLTSMKFSFVSATLEGWSLPSIIRKILWVLGY